MRGRVGHYHPFHPLIGQRGRCGPARICGGSTVLSGALPTMEQDKPYTPPKAFSSYRRVFSIFLFLKRFSRKMWISEFSASGLSPKGSSSSGISRKWIDFLNKETTKDKRNKPNRCNPGHRSFTEAYSGHGCSYSRKRMSFLSL